VFSFQSSKFFFNALSDDEMLYEVFELVDTMLPTALLLNLKLICAALALELVTSQDIGACDHVAATVSFARTFV